MSSVRAANRMIWRVVALLLICSSKGVWWILEQPERSLMEHHPAMQLLFGLVKCHRVSLNMEDFGARSRKPTWLYTSALSAHKQSDCMVKCLSVGGACICCCSDREILRKLPSLKPPADELPTDEQKRAWEMSVRYTDESGNKQRR